MARRRYKEFVQEGIIQGSRADLSGGGLIRSHGGWAAVGALRRAKIFQKSDERILGDGDFVEEVLSASQESMERKYHLQARGIDLATIASRVSELMGVEPLGLWGPGKERNRVSARSLLCYWAVRGLGLSMTELSRKLRLSLSGVSQSVKRGEKMAENKA
jgi:putative transposase